MAPTSARGSRHSRTIRRRTFRQAKDRTSNNSKRRVELLRKNERQNEERLHDLRKNSRLQSAKHHQHDQAPGEKSIFSYIPKSDHINHGQAKAMYQYLTKNVRLLSNFYFKKFVLILENEMKLIFCRNATITISSSSFSRIQAALRRTSRELLLAMG